MHTRELSTYIKDGKLKEQLLDIYLDKDRLAYQTNRYLDALTHYEELFGEADVQIISAPGRTEVGGNHTDHQHGQVLAASINDDAIAIVSANESGLIRVKSEGYDMITLASNDTEKQDAEEGTSLALLKGILACTREKGYRTGSFDAYITSDVLGGSGLSSSASIEVGMGLILKTLFEFPVTMEHIALLSQYSENHYNGLNCGIMDQFIIAVGKKNTAIALDCNTLAYEYAPLELGDWRFVVMNTNKVRKLADSKYNERRSQCEFSLDVLIGKGFKIQSLCQLTPAMWEEAKQYITDPVLQRRVKHCVFENQRVLDAVAALKANDLQKLGALLKASHQSLKDDYEVTGIELDTLAETAWKQEGCLGARMTGAGFGGCAIALVHKDKVDAFIENVQKEYTAKIGYAAGFFACESGDGVARVNL